MVTNLKTIQLYKVIYALVLAFALSACNDTSTDNATEKKAEDKAQTSEIKTESQPAKEKSKEKKAEVSEYKTIKWTDLIPKEELDILSNPPDYINDIEDGSLEDRISSQVENTLTLAGDDEYQQALSSTNIIPEMVDQAVRIPGFIVPLEFNADKSVKEFFLVPFFGACIHVPPPPPNQMFYIDHPEGVEAEGLSYNPFWLSGIIRSEVTANDLGTAAYTLEMHKFEPYLDEEEE